MTEWLNWTELNWKAEIEEEQKSFLMRVKKESEKAVLKLHIQKTKIMASGPIISWKIDGKKVATVAYFIFMGYKITVNSVCRHKIKRQLLLGKKTMTNLAAYSKAEALLSDCGGPYSQGYVQSRMDVRVES